MDTALPQLTITTTTMCKRKTDELEMSGSTVPCKLIQQRVGHWDKPNDISALASAVPGLASGPNRPVMCILNFSVCNWSMHNSFLPQTMMAITCK